jgi:antitoxin component YwqK of YwqJK toxin-antitoxin module
MKTFLIFIILLIYAIEVESQSFRIYNNDTINYTNISGQKQGLWIYFLNDETSISQKGEYVDSKKDGVWYTYYENGNVKSLITYSKNKQNGYAIIYYEDGTVSEEGLWKENRWTGEYKYYYESGKPAYEWNFDAEGNRSGNQKYFYENGKIKIDGNWEAGKEQGIVKEYYENGNLKTVCNWDEGKTNGSKKEYYINGQLKSEKLYAYGVPDENSTIYYALIDNTNTIDIDTIYTVIIEKDSTAALFTGSGFHKLYNKKQLLEQEGYFKNGYLIDGKKYFYSLEGILVRTEIYEEGKLTESIKEK